MPPKSKRRKVHREAPEVGEMTRRMVRALLRRAAEGDWEALTELTRLEAATREAVGHALVAMHDGRIGYSWTELGDVLGVSRQAAEQRANRARGTMPPGLVVTDSPGHA